MKSALPNKQMQTDKKWFSLNISVDTRAVEAIEFALNELESSGTEINNLGKLQTQTETEVIGYFNEKPDDEFVQNHINEALRIYGFTPNSVKQTEWREVENKDWLAEWKKGWKSTETAKFIIAPMWETVERSDKIVVRIEPSMAFGTGTHETTRLCLRAIEENYAGGSFLDVGTGTGILAIAAAKIESQVSGFESQASSLKSQVEENSIDHSPFTTHHYFLACDTDEDSIKIARENAEINDVSKIEFYVGSISDETPQFDFVCANLTADVIVPLLPLLFEKTTETLVLSGILKEQEGLITGELDKLQIADYKIQTDREWISITVGRRQLAVGS